MSSQCLSIVGAAAGTLGSVICAFSLNRVLTALMLAREAMDATLQAVVKNADPIVVFTGFDKRLTAASRRSAWLIWIGVALLAVGFIAQAMGVMNISR